MNIKMRYLTIIAVGMLLAANPAVSDEGVDLIGPGANSCGKFIVGKEKYEELRLVHTAWAQGFLTGLNIKYLQSLESATELPDHAAMELWIKNYCEENPLDNYAFAIRNLWRELRARQGLERDPHGL